MEVPFLLPDVEEQVTGVPQLPTWENVPICPLCCRVIFDRDEVNRDYCDDAPAHQACVDVHLQQHERL